MPKGVKTTRTFILPETLFNETVAEWEYLGKRLTPNGANEFIRRAGWPEGANAVVLVLKNNDQRNND